MSSLNEATNEKYDNLVITKCPCCSNGTQCDYKIPFVQLEQITVSKGQKRKVQDNVESDRENCNKNMSSDNKHLRTLDSSDSINIQSSKRRETEDVGKFHHKFDGTDNKIEESCEHVDVCSKYSLTPTNVENILQHVITNDYVLAMAHNTRKIKSVPKLTRSKVKKLGAKHPRLLWPSPIQIGDQMTKNLLEEEFPDESLDDENYEPEEEESSDDDDMIHSLGTSESMSPHTLLTKSSPCTSPEDATDDYCKEETPFVVPMSDLNHSQEVYEADKIALRTRSKLSLNNTSLEEIEDSFFDPDITVDMYDTSCDDDDDDWLQFLTDLRKPIDQIGEADDIEYDAQEDDDSRDPLDFINDPTTKVSRKELNSLMEEILVFTQKEHSDDYNNENDSHANLNQSSFDSVDDSSVLAKPQPELMTSDEKLQLDEQIRMYVQLLTQSYLLSHGSPDLNFLNISCKLFLDELKMFVSQKLINNKRSVFNAHNLEGAINIVNMMEKEKFVIINEEMEKKRCPIPVFAKRIIATSKVFIYPELLPRIGYSDPFQNHKTTFSDAEDNLIALGLDQFYTVNNYTLDAIHSLLVPSKTPGQIRVRIKNCRAAKISLKNPIKHFTVHKEAPQFPRWTRKFYPENIKIPAEHPLKILPKWMTYYCRVASGDPLVAPPPVTCGQLSLLAPRKPCKTMSLPKSVAVPRPSFPKKPRFILPYGGIISPLQHFNINMKTYSKKEKTITVLPVTLPCSNRTKSGYCLSKTSLKPPAIEPIAVSTNDSVCVDSSSLKSQPIKPNSVSTNDSHCVTTSSFKPEAIKPNPVSTNDSHCVDLSSFKPEAIKPNTVSTNDSHCVASSSFKPQAIKPNLILTNNGNCIDFPENHISVSNTDSLVIQQNQTVSTLLNMTTIQPTIASVVQPMLLSTNPIINWSFSCPMANQIISNETFFPTQNLNVNKQSEQNSNLNNSVLNEIATVKEEEPINEPANNEICSISEDIKPEEMSEDESSSEIVDTTIAEKHSVCKSNDKFHEDLESSVTLLKPSVMNNSPVRSEEETSTNQIISISDEDSSLLLDDHLNFEPAISAVSCSQPSRESNICLNYKDNMQHKGKTSLLSSRLCDSIETKEFEESTIEISAVETQKKSHQTLESINNNQKKIIDCLEIIIKNQEVQIRNQTSLLQFLAENIDLKVNSNL